MYSLISEKAVINVVRTYHVLANLHFPKTLYHLTKTVLFLARHITHSEYQRYLVLNEDEEFNGVRLHTSIGMSRVEDKREAEVFESETSTSRAHKLHQTHAEYFLGWYSLSDVISSTMLKRALQLEVEASSVDILSVD